VLRLSTTTTGVTIGGILTATGGNSGNWNTAYGWGNHASAGYTNDQTAAEILTAIKTVDGSGSGLDADLLDGLELHTGRNNNANKVVRTDGNGYIQAGWINTTSGATTGTNRIYTSNDGYIRYCTMATFKTNLGLWHSGNDGASSGLDAGLLAGALPAEGSIASTIVKRDSAQSIVAKKIYSTDGTNTISTFVGSTYNQISSIGSQSGGARDLRFNLGQVGTIMTIISNKVQMHKPLLLDGSANTSFATSNINSTQSSDVNGSARFHMNFTKANGTTSLGRITSNNYGTTYTTSSDYRLKEDLLEVTDATARLLSIQTRNFKWIGTDFRTDGFLAHELALVVPDAVVGEKDAMSTPTLYSEEEELPEGVSVGDVKVASVPDYQSIDQSKLVPLLIKTVQELEARIRALENS
jgi:hypothetical protein